MSTITRICPSCGAKGRLDSPYCAGCGIPTTDHETPVTERAGKSNPTASVFSLSNSGSLSLRKAAFPLVVGAVGFLAKVGWRILQSKTARDVAYNAANRAVQSKLQRQSPASLQRSVGSKLSQQDPPSFGLLSSAQPKRTIRIRSQWAVGNDKEITQQGQSEHIIELDYLN